MFLNNFAYDQETIRADEVLPTVGTASALPPVVYQATDVFSRIWQIVKGGWDPGGTVYTDPSAGQSRSEMLRLLYIGGFVIVLVFAVRFMTAKS